MKGLRVKKIISERPERSTNPKRGAGIKVLNPNKHLLTRLLVLFAQTKE